MEPLLGSLYQKLFLLSRVAVIHHFQFNTESYSPGRKLLSHL